MPAPTPTPARAHPRLHSCSAPLACRTPPSPSIHQRQRQPLRRSTSITILRPRDRPEIADCPVELASRSRPTIDPSCNMNGASGAVRTAASSGCPLTVRRYGGALHSSALPWPALAVTGFAIGKITLTASSIAISLSRITCPSNPSRPCAQCHFSNATTVARSSVTCTALTRVTPATSVPSVYAGIAEPPAATYASCNAVRISFMCTHFDRRDSHLDSVVRPQNGVQDAPSLWPDIRKCVNGPGTGSSHSSDARELITHCAALSPPFPGALHLVARPLERRQRKLGQPYAGRPVQPARQRDCHHLGVYAKIVPALNPFS